MFELKRFTKIKTTAYSICDGGKLMIRSELIGNVSDLTSSDPGSNPAEVTLDKDKDKDKDVYVYVYYQNM